MFGSYARGDFKINADIDVMIWVDTSEIEMKECENKIYVWHIISTVNMI